MQQFSKVMIGTGILAAIVSAGILVGWLGSRVSSNKDPVRPPDDSPATSGARSLTPLPNNPVEPKPSPPIIPLVVPTATPDAATTNVTVAWEDRVDEILGGEDDDTNKVKQLFALLPTLPEDGQEEVAQHLSNLVADEDYTPLGELLKNPNLPESVLDTLMADVLNRPNSVKLPMFLELARTPAHPKAEESMDYLELFLDEEYGTDWNKWQEKLQEWLKENPD